MQFMWESVWKHLSDKGYIRERPVLEDTSLRFNLGLQISCKNLYQGHEFEYVSFSKNLGSTACHTYLTNYDQIWKCEGILKCTGTRDADQLVECLPSMYKVMGSIPSNTKEVINGI
jgi:hypothetical protein